MQAATLNSIPTDVPQKNNEEAKSSILKKNGEEKETEEFVIFVWHGSSHAYSCSPWWQQYNPKSVICYVAWIESL